LKKTLEDKHTEGVAVSGEILVPSDPEAAAVVEWAGRMGSQWAATAGNLIGMGFPARWVREVFVSDVAGRPEAERKGSKYLLKILRRFQAAGQSDDERQGIAPAGVGIAPAAPGSPPAGNAAKTLSFADKRNREIAEELKALDFSGKD
jgi:hypothetical protein